LADHHTSREFASNIRGTSGGDWWPGAKDDPQALSPATFAD